jgi:hypothetical protein
MVKGPGTLSMSKDYIIESDIARPWRAVNFCCELSFYGMILKGDALQMMQALRKDDAKANMNT